MNLKFSLIFFFLVQSVILKSTICLNDNEIEMLFNNIKKYENEIKACQKELLEIPFVTHVNRNSNISISIPSYHDILTSKVREDMYKRLENRISFLTRKRNGIIIILYIFANTLNNSNVCASCSIEKIEMLNDIIFNYSDVISNYENKEWWKENYSNVIFGSLTFFLGFKLLLKLL